MSVLGAEDGRGGVAHLRQLCAPGSGLDLAPCRPMRPCTTLREGVCPWTTCALLFRRAPRRWHPGSAADRERLALAGRAAERERQGRDPPERVLAATPLAQVDPAGRIRADRAAVLPPECQGN